MTIGICNHTQGTYFQILKLIILFTKSFFENVVNI